MTNESDIMVFSTNNTDNSSDVSTTTSATATPDTSSPALQIVDLDEITLKEKIGHGSYGVVYKAEWAERIVAVKEFAAGSEQKAFETEIKQLSRVQHPNIIALFGISNDLQSKFIIMEHAEGGSLHTFLHGAAKPYYSTAHAMSWARQCAEGVAYLHTMKPKPLIHRDLKPLNLLLSNKARFLKICDFGTVADKQTLMTNNKGSAAWMAPEVFEGSRYTEKCDIFSWAIVLWEVLSRKQPFKDIDNTYQIMWKIHKGHRPPLIKDCPEPIEKLMTSCWDTLPDERPSMQHVVAVMNELVASFPGAEEAIEYEFVNQHIILPDSYASDTTGDNYKLDFSSFTSSNSNSIQSTPTNSTDALTPTNSGSIFDVPIIKTSRWDAIPEEPDTSFDHTPTGDNNNLFNLTPSAEASQRYETIRNGMAQMATKLMAPLNVDVDLNAWDLASTDVSAKTDAKERLTVTDAKPILAHATTITNNESATDIATYIANKTSAYKDNDNNIISSEDNDDEDENDGTEQSLVDMLDPELQPESPIPNNPESQAIYREHQRLAKEYLRVNTDLYYAMDLKEKILLQMDPDERQKKQALLKKLKEKEELLSIYNVLKAQVNASTAPQSSVVAQQQQQLQLHQNAPSLPSTPSSNELVADDGWVVIAPNTNT